MADRISYLSATDNRSKKSSHLLHFRLQFDEITGITNVAQLATFIRGVDETFTVTKEFLELVLMMGTTTANNIFLSLVGALERVGVEWVRAVSVAINGTPSMMGKIPGCCDEVQRKKYRL